MLFDEEFEERTRRSYQDFQQLQSTHLKSPLRPDYGKYFWNHPVGNPNRFQSLHNEFATLSRLAGIDKTFVDADFPSDFSKTIFPWLLCLPDARLDLPTTTRKAWMVQSASWRRVVDDEINAVRNVVGLHWDDMNLTCPWELDHTTAVYKYAREQLDSTVITSGNFARSKRNAKPSSTESLRTEIIGGLAVTVTNNLCLMRFKDHAFFGNRDYLLHVSDLVSERYLLLSSSVIADELELSHYLPKHCLMSLFQWGDRVIENTGILGYNLIKAYEPLVTVKLLEYGNDPVCSAEEFRETIMDDLNEKAPELAIEGRHLLDILDRECLNVHHLSQSFGLYRVWGHPIIDVKEGVKKLKKLTTTKKVIPVSLRNELEACFKEHFCLNYYFKHGKWPKLRTEELNNDSYLKIVIGNNLSLNISNPNYNVKDWLKVHAEKTFSCDSTYTLSQMIADSALSLTRLGIKDSVARTKTIGEAFKRRVLTNWLKSGFTSCKDLLDHIDKFGFDTDDLIIGITPKEREEKIIPRMFALLTLTLRMYIVSLGQLSADYLTPYFPEITMMDDSLDLNRRLYKMTSASDPRHLREIDVIMNVDFEKWNSNIREELTAGPFKFLDELFGYTNCFQRVPEMFRKSYIYLADNSYLPKIHDDLTIDEDTFCWTNHLGGLEGLNQKPWTACTVVLISIVTKRHGLKYKLIGQGDNQVLRLTIPLDRSLENDRDLQMEDARRRVAQFKEDFVKYMSMAGLPVKSSETWTSSDLLAYGKALFFKGAPLAMAQKKLSRVFPLSNELFPSLENSISTIFSNAMAATQSDLTCLIPFLIAIQETLYTFILFDKASPLVKNGMASEYRKSEGIWSVNVRFQDAMKFNISEARAQNKIYNVIKSAREILRPTFPECVRTGEVSQDEDVLSCLCIFPKIMGGYPIQYLSNFFCRGFPDQLTESLMMLRRICDVTPRYKIQQFIKGLSSIPFCPTSAPDMLVQDAYSVNYLTPSSTVGSLKTAVRRFLTDSDIVENPYFKQFFTITEHETSNLCYVLTDTEPIWPRILHDIFNASVFGFAMSVVGKIVKATTLVSHATSDPELRIKDRLRESEIRYFNSVIYKLNLTGKIWICDTLEAQRLRDESWRQFAPICGVTTPHPFSYIQMYTVGADPCLYCADKRNTEAGGMKPDDYLLLHPDRRLMSSPQECSLKIGPCRPYMGSKTEDKSYSQHMSALQTIDPLIKRAGQVLRLIEWVTDLDDSLSRFLIRMFRSMTDIPPDLFFSIPGSISGSAEHRYRDYTSFHGGLLSTLYTLPSYVHLSTNMIQTFSKGEENVKIHFQALMLNCSTSFLMRIRPTYSWSIHSVHYHFVCEHCIQPVADDYVSGGQALDEYEFPSYSNNRFCFVSASDVILEQRCSFKIENNRTLDDLSRAEQSLIRADALGYDAMRACRHDAYCSNTTELSSVHVIPIGWAKFVDGLRMIESIAAFVFTDVFIKLAKRQEIRLSMTREDVVHRVLMTIGTYDPSAFGCCGLLFHFDFTRVRLSLSKYGIVGPVSFPMRNKELASACKNAVMTVIQTDHWEFSGNIINVNNSLLNPLEFVLYQIIACVWRCQDLRSSWRSLLLLATTDLSEFDESVPIERIVNAVLTIKLSESPSLSEAAQTLIADSWGRALNWMVWVSTFITTDKLVKTIEPDLWTLGDLETLVHPLHDDQANEVHCERYLVSADLPTNVHYLAWDRAGYTRLLNTNGLDIARRAFEGISAPLHVYDRILTTHAYRPVILHTTAHYKYAPLLIQVKQQIGSTSGVAVVVGDGTGGISLLTSLLFPGFKVIFNSLIELHDIVSHSLPSFYPPCLDFLPDKNHHFLGLQQSLEGVTDITDEDFFKQILMMAEGREIKLIICDAEGGGWESAEKGINLCNSICSIARRSSSHVTAILKTYASNTLMLTAQIGMLFSVFKEVKLVRSIFSTASNTECFLIGQDQDDLFDYLWMNVDNNTLEDVSIPREALTVVEDRLKEIYRQTVVPSWNQSLEISELLARVLTPKVSISSLRRSCVIFPPESYLSQEHRVHEAWIWGSYPPKFTSRLRTAAKKNLKNIRLSSGYSLARDFCLHFLLCLQQFVSFDCVTSYVVPKLINSGWCVFYVDTKFRTTLMIMNEEEAQQMKRSYPDLSIYYVDLRSAFDLSSLKRLYRSLGQFRLFFTWTGRSNIKNVLWSFGRKQKPKTRSRNDPDNSEPENSDDEEEEQIVNKNELQTFLHDNHSAVSTWEDFVIFYIPLSRSPGLLEIQKFTVEKLYVSSF